MFRPSNPFSRPPAPPQDTHNGQTYLPPGIRRAMNEYENSQPGNGAPPQVIAPTQQSQPEQPVNAPPVVSAPMPPAASTAPQGTGQPYDFITDPAAPPKQPLFSGLLGGGSMVVRIALVVGALIVFIIIISVFKNIAGKAGQANAAALISVAQDQQELLHLANEISQAQNNLSANSQNFTATLQLSLSTSQSQIISYLTAGHKKITAKQLSLKISTATDNQLSAADTAGTLDQTYRQVMQTELNSYGKDLQKAYAQDKGPKARAMLNDSYQQAKLLSTQLNSPAS